MSTTTRSPARKLGLLFAASTLAFVATACGSGNSDDTSGASDTGSSDNATPTGYAGYDLGVAHDVPEPAVKKGTKFTVAYLGPQQSERSLSQLADSVKKQTDKLGGTFILKDANGSPDTQVSQFNEALAQNVDAIVLHPVDPRALTAQLERAANEGIPVVTISAPPVSTKPPLPGILLNLTQGLNQAAYYDAKAIASTKPGAKFAVLSIGQPIPIIAATAEMMKAAGIEAGLKYVATADATLPTPDAAAVAMSSLLAKNPDVDAVMAITDTLGLAASSVARQQGKTLLITGGNADPAGVDAVLSGKLLATFDYDYPGAGTQLANALYTAVTNPGAKIPTNLVRLGTPIVKANAEAFQKAN